jgi:hypothetical protein
VDHPADHHPVLLLREQLGRQRKRLWEQLRLREQLRRLRL